MSDAAFAVTFEGELAEQCGKAFCISHQTEYHRTGGEDVHKTTIRGELSLGHAVAWLMVNRPTNCTCTVKENDVRSEPFVLRPSRVPVSQGNRTTFDADPSECVEVFHLHCHFKPTTEGVARALLETTKGVVEGAVLDGALHDHVWHEKNGPHISHSWELWVEAIPALGAAVQHLMRSRHPNLRVCLHCDTDQEFTDHAARMAFIGPEDELHFEFFSPPGSSYNGPCGPRVTCSAFIYSMGEQWPRGELAASYGAIDRGSSSGSNLGSGSGSGGSQLDTPRGSNQGWDASPASDLDSRLYPKGC